MASFLLAANKAAAATSERPPSTTGVSSPSRTGPMRSPVLGVLGAKVGRCGSGLPPRSLVRSLSLSSCQLPAFSVLITMFVQRTDHIPEDVCGCLSSCDVTKLTGSFRLITAVVDGATGASEFLCFYPYCYYCICLYGLKIIIIVIIVIIIVYFPAFYFIHVLMISFTLL